LFEFESLTPNRGAPEVLLHAAFRETAETLRKFSEAIDGIVFDDFVWMMCGAITGELDAAHQIVDPPRYPRCSGVFSCCKFVLFVAIGAWLAMACLLAASEKGCKR
jgi:hypothetical protein